MDEWYQVEGLMNQFENYPKNEKYYKGISLTEAKTYLDDAIKKFKYRKNDNSLEDPTRTPKDLGDFFHKSKEEAKIHLKEIRDTLLNCQTKRMVEALRKDDLKQCYYFQIQNFFKHNRKEYKSIYIDNPKQFYDRFIAIAHRFRTYNRHKRKEFIYEELLKHKNKEVFDDLAEIQPEHEQKKVEIKRLKISRDYLNTKERFFETLDKYERSFKNELESEETKININQKRINLRQEIIEKFEKLAKDEEISFGKVYDRNATLEFIKENSDSLTKTKVEQYENFIDTENRERNENPVQIKLRKKVKEYQEELLSMIQENKWLINSDYYDKMLFEDLRWMDVTTLRVKYRQISKSQRRYFEKERSAIEKSEKEIKEGYK